MYKILVRHQIKLQLLTDFNKDKNTKIKLKQLTQKLVPGYEIKQNFS